MSQMNVNVTVNPTRQNPNTNSPPRQDLPTCSQQQDQASGSRSTCLSQDRLATTSSRTSTAEGLLRQISQRAARFDRRPEETRSDPQKLLRAAVEQVISGASERAIAQHGWWVGKVAATSGAMTAATGWYEGLKLGIEAMNNAHAKALQHGVRAHTARGLAQTLALAARHPTVSLGRVETMSVAQARREHDAQQATDVLHRGGQALSKDTDKRNRCFEGMRRGIQLALRLLGPLSTEQRRAIGEIARREGDGSIERGLLRLAQPAAGADSIHARLR